MLSSENPLFAEFLLIFPKLIDLKIIAISAKLKDLLHYDTIYYIREYQVWVVLGGEFLKSHTIGHAVFRPFKFAANLYLHEHSMLCIKRLEEIRDYVPVDNIKNWNVLTSDKINEFVDFLDQNHDWLNAVSKVKKYVNF